jgi:hypothetical protein
VVGPDDNLEKGPHETMERNMKDIKELPITLQVALAIKTPELFNKEHYGRLMKVKNVVMEKMYKEYVKKRSH